MNSNSLAECLPSFQGVFKQRYPGQLRGKDWPRQLPAEDRKILGAIGAEYHEHGHLGGVARARTAARDGRGRFTTEGR